MGFFDRLFEPPQPRRTVTALVDRIEEALGHADLRRYDGYDGALRVPGSFACRFARLAEELECLRLQASSLAAAPEREGPSRDSDLELTRLQSELEPLETLTLAAVTFRHAQLDLDRTFFGHASGTSTDASLSLYSTDRDHTFCELNARFIALEQAFWTQPAAHATDLGARLELESRSFALRSDCRAFLGVAPSPALASEVRRHLDCAANIVRETPYYREHVLRTWLVDAVEALEAWDRAMSKPFSRDEVLDAYAGLESISLYPQSAGLAHAVTFESEPAAVTCAWRDHIVESLVGNDTISLYREAVEARRWTTAAFVYGVALASQKRETECVRAYDLAADTALPRAGRDLAR